MHQKEQCSVIRFLSIEGVKPIEIHPQMEVQYGDACLSLQQVYERTRKFMNGIRSDEKCSRRYTIGSALNQKNLFLEVSMHFLNAGTLVWNVMETTQKK
jgi:predicted nuclease with RNAse H fold